MTQLKDLAKFKINGKPVTPFWFEEATKIDPNALNKLCVAKAAADVLDLNPNSSDWLSKYYPDSGPTTGRRSRGIIVRTNLNH